ncbi:IS5 family transposase [Streptomyces sp. NPDC059649]|uniref:IS5 family transposase n=1 Tax=Streptomyces sp. NPDC059649 TaxID=3346895 RepID=UPI00367C7F74
MISCGVRGKCSPSRVAWRAGVLWSAARAAGDPSTAGADANGTRAPDPDRAAVRRRRRARAEAAGLGRSRGGLSSKVHAAVDATGLPLSFVLTPGQAGDSPQFQTVLGKIRIPGPVGRPRTRPEPIAADRAYSSKGNRAYLRRRCITAVILEKIDQQPSRKKKGSVGGRPVTYDKERYKQRNTVELCFQKIKTWRGLATRYDKAPDSYAAGLHLRGSIKSTAPVPAADRCAACVASPNAGPR